MHKKIYAEVLVKILIFIVTAITPIGFVLTAMLTWVPVNTPRIICGVYLFSVCTINSISNTTHFFGK